MKEFKKLLNLISNYNQDKSIENQISWQGFFIVREKTQHPEEIFQKIKQSNGKLWLGVESVIKRVRYEMGKNFSDESIDYHLEMTQKYQIPILILMMIGNPTETLTDYEFTKQWFRERYQYAGNSIEGIILSMSAVLPGTAWDKKQEEMHLDIGKFPVLWINQETKITAAQRLAYWNELEHICAPYHEAKIETKDFDSRQEATLKVLEMFSKENQ